MLRYFLSLFYVITFTTTLFSQPRVDFVHCYGDDGSQYFEDIYAVANGDFVMCGYSKIRNGRSNFDEQIYVVKANGAGEELWSLTFGQDSVSSKAFTIIELDNGDYAVGGSDSNYHVMVARITSDGDIEWMRTYERGSCRALIELKNDDLALAGKLVEGSVGLLMRLDANNGDVVWQYEFDEYTSTTLHGLRETDGGLMAGGYNFTGDRQHRLFIGEFDQADGEPIWWQDYEQSRPPDNAYDAAFAMTSHPRGFVLAGRHNWTHIDTPCEGNTLMVDPDGEEIWRRIRNAGVDGFSMGWYGICRLPSGDLVQAGMAGWNSSHPVMNWITANGEELWHELYDVRELGNFGQERGYFKSVVSVGNESVVACGHILNLDDNRYYDGFIMKLVNLHSDLEIYFRSPVDSVLTVLQDDTLRFTVGARDPFDQDLSYLWLRNGADTLSTDTTALVRFPEFGQDTITCQVSSGERTALARWLVNVTAFYISEFSPDSLDLLIRRNTAVDFSVRIRQLVDEEVNYIWTLTDRWRQNHEVGDDDSASVLFDIKGDHMLECVAWRDDFADV